MKMGRTACWLSHAVGRRQASLGTPVPRTPTVAPGPKVRSGLASRQCQGSSSEHRGTQKPAASVDAWQLIGCGRLRFPTLPWQLHDLTSPWCVRGALLLERRLFPRVHLDLFAQELRKFIRRCAKRFAVHPRLDLALCITVPKGHRLGGMHQFLGSHEGGSREGREERNAREAGGREMLARAPS